MKTVAVLGEGAWGTAVATLLAHNGFTIKLWCHHKEVAQSIAQTGINERYLPGVPLLKTIEPVTDLQQVFHEADTIFEAIPVAFLRSVLERCVPHVTPEHLWVVLSKGVENKTLLVPSQIIADVIPDALSVAVSGPSFAHDVVQQQPTGFTVAAHDTAQAQRVADILATSFVTTDISDDILGVQIAGAFKNVVTLAVGMLDGAGYTDNTKALAVTRGLHEIGQLIVAGGGAQKTLYSLAGVGDLVLTALGGLSRNLKVGQLIGQGKSLETILHETGYIPEGVNTVKSVHAFIQQHSLSVPLCSAVYDVLFNEKSIECVVDALLC